MSNRQETIEFILDHYENPRNHGRLERATMVMKGGNPTCGDVVTIYMRVDDVTQRIEELSFTGEGCTISQAAASLTTSRLVGRRVSEARVARAADVLIELSESIMGTRRRCATLALHTVRAAITQYLHDQPDDTQGATESSRGLRFERQE